MTTERDTFYEMVEDIGIAMMTTRRPDGHLESWAMARSLPSLSKRAHGPNVLCTVDCPIRGILDAPQALASALEREHYDVVVARTGEDGFSQANAEVFDLVLLDLMSREASAFELLGDDAQRERLHFGGGLPRSLP